MIYDLDDVKSLSQVGAFGARASKWVGRGGAVIGYAAGGYEVYQTYKRGGDWQDQAVGIGTEMIAIETAGAIMLELTPVGWAATIAVGVGEGLAYAFAGGKIEHWGDEFSDWLRHVPIEHIGKEAYHWLKSLF